MPMSQEEVREVVRSVLIPPLGVYRRMGYCREFVLNILLTLLGYIPGVLHVLYLMIEPQTRGRILFYRQYGKELKE